MAESLNLALKLLVHLSSLGLDLDFDHVVSLLNRLYLHKLVNYVLLLILYDLI